MKNKFQDLTFMLPIRLKVKETKNKKNLLATLDRKMVLKSFDEMSKLDIIDTLLLSRGWSKTK